jgi:hypothetical protein
MSKYAAERAFKLNQQMQELNDNSPCDECDHESKHHQSAYYGECSWLEVTCWSEYKCVKCWGDKEAYS